MFIMYNLQEDNLSIETDLRGFFVGTASFDKHFDAQESNKTRYVAGMTVLNKNGVEISQSKFKNFSRAINQHLIICKCQFYSESDTDLN